MPTKRKLRRRKAAKLKRIAQTILNRITSKLLEDPKINEAIFELKATGICYVRYDGG